MRHKLSHKKIIRYVKILLYASGAFFIAFLLFAFIVSTLYKDEVKEFIIQELNKSLRTEIIIGDTDLSLFRHFPYASFSIHNVFAKDATDFEEKDTLLFAKRIDLSFNMINIFRKRYNVRAVNVSDAILKVKVFDDYSNNYTFWKSAEESLDDAFEINLEKISCQNLNVFYTHAPAQQFYDIFFKEGLLSGKIYKDEFSINVTAEAFVNSFLSGDLNFLGQKHTSVKLLLDVSTNTETYAIRKGTLKLGDMSFNVYGDVFSGDFDTDLNLKITSNRLKLQDLIRELPEQYRAYFDNFEMQGIVHFVVDITGAAGGGQIPLLNMNCEMTSGSLTQKTSGVSLRDLSFKGTYSNGQGRSLASSQVFLERFSASLKQGHVNGQVEIKNFVSPHIALTLNLRAHLQELFALVYPELFDHISGAMNGSVSFTGHLKSLEGFVVDDFIRSRCEGYLNVQNAALSFNNKSFSAVNAALKFNNNDVVIDSLSALYGNSDIAFKGYFRNALAYVFIPKEKIFVDASLFSENLLLDDILADNNTQGSSTATSYKLSFSDRVNFRFRVFADNLRFDKFFARQLNGSFTLNNKVLTAENISFNALDGNVSLSGKVNGRDERHLLVESRALFSRCDINKMFQQLNNFGQENLTHHNLKGNFTASVNYSGKWQADLSADMPSVRAQAQIVIENGELLGYNPIMELSRFIRLRDLSHISFETMENTFDIKEQCIHIPHMEIRSDAVNIKASGTHHFNNNIDYRLEVRLSELLGRKARREKPENVEFAIIQDETQGGLTLFLKITGHIDNPIVSYDTRTAVTRVTTDIRTDVKSTLEKIKEEFSPNVRDTINRFETEKEKERRLRRRENEIPTDFRLE